MRAGRPHEPTSPLTQRRAARRDPSLVAAARSADRPSAPRRRSVGLALAIISLQTADMLQVERYVARKFGTKETASAQATKAVVAAARKKEAEEDGDAAS